MADEGAGRATSFPGSSLSLSLAGLCSCDSQDVKPFSQLSSSNTQPNPWLCIAGMIDIALANWKTPKLSKPASPSKMRNAKPHPKSSLVRSMQVRLSTLVLLHLHPRFGVRHIPNRNVLGVPRNDNCPVQKNKRCNPLVVPPLRHRAQLHWSNSKPQCCSCFYDPPKWIMERTWGYGDVVPGITSFMLWLQGMFHLYFPYRQKTQLLHKGNEETHCLNDELWNDHHVSGLTLF